ncbi:hypothetical protein A3K42_00750 [candidate division WWE3 bacterium RBG_13_37_7]|uniref:Uncharacterized protein n=1 Tax=candidate division WWE3 bacterium RBG_13_37_7 TaxID=1802609 RepID=A0A1F4U0T2_UNCKA|nr:MAG: hypothetical protein A3K42_00750 [candidate division WWE3 bacterium RBG_13_37_7]
MSPEQLIQKIIAEQSLIIGADLAIARAKSTNVIDCTNIDHIKLNKEPRVVVEKLINAYEDVFGQSSVNVCIDVIRSFPYEQIAPFLPSSLKNSISFN